MKLVSTLTLKGGEKLARDIINSSGIILISAGTEIKKEYINKLNEIGQNVVFIESDDDIRPDYETQQIIINDCTQKVKEVFDKYFSSISSNLDEVCGIAEEIIDEIIRKPEVILNINSIRMHDENKYLHSINVCTMSVIIAAKLKIDKSKIKDIAVGSLLHDIGYEYVNALISSNLSADISLSIESEMKKHVIYGYSSVQNEKWIGYEGKNIILSHHEKIDGSGYPFHLKDKNITIGAKIVCVCNEFDNLIYRKNFKVHNAIEYIVSEAGNKFDFEIVKIFNESIAAYPIGTIVITNNGEKGIVIRQNNKCPTRPVIRIVRENDYQNNYIEKDLTKDLTLFITDTVDKIR